MLNFRIGSNVRGVLPAPRVQPMTARAVSIEEVFPVSAAATVERRGEAAPTCGFSRADAKVDKNRITTSRENPANAKQTRSPSASLKGPRDDSSIDSIGNQETLIEPTDRS